MYIELNDEILNGEPRFRLRNNAGDIIFDNVSIEQITPILQEPTIINKILFDSIYEKITQQNIVKVPQSILDQDVAILTLNRVIDEYVNNIILRIRNNTPHKMYTDRYANVTLAKKYIGSTDTGTPSNVSVDFFNKDVTSTESSGYIDAFNNGYAYSWVYFKLLKPILAKKMVLRYYSGSKSTYRNYYSKNYKISGSNDGINWTEIYSGTEGSYGEYTVNLDANNSFYQYYRFDMLNKNDTVWLYGIRISEYYMKMNEITDPLLQIEGLEEKSINGTLKDGYIYDLIYNGNSWDLHFSADETNNKIAKLENAIVSLGGTI